MTEKSYQEVITWHFPVFVKNQDDPDDKGHWEDVPTYEGDESGSCRIIVVPKYLDVAVDSFYCDPDGVELEYFYLKNIVAWANLPKRPFPKEKA